MERRINRFDKFMDFRGLNDNKVTHEASLSIGTLGKSRKEGKDLSDKNVEKILKCYLDLNRKWLLYGEGDMFKDSTSIVEEPTPSRCRICVEKENEIRKLKDKITFLNESIHEYKAEAAQKDQQIGKLKSILEQNGVIF